LLSAAAVGAFADLYVMGDEYSNAAAVALWCALAGLLLVPLILNFGAKRTLLISAAVWAGMTIAHTIVLIVETSADPTSHNLWPFEYLMLALVAVPALLGATAGRFAGQAWAAGTGSTARSNARSEV
jgi:hypothetical protein